MKYRFVRKPRPYQMAALKKALELDKLAIWFDPGLGKTKVAIDFTAIKVAKGEVDRIIVVCPLSAMGVWEDEFLSDCPPEFQPCITTVVGKMKQRLAKIKQVYDNPSLTPQMLILNYDSLLNDEVLSLIMAWAPQLLIADEMHFLKNPRIERSKRTYQIRQRCKFCLGLTGTPIPKNPLDLFGQYRIINDEVFGTDRGAYKRFRDRYAVMNFKFPTKVDSWKNLDELSRKIHTFAYRAKDSECIGLPELIIKDVPVYFEDKTKTIYNQMATEMIAELENCEVVTAPMAATKVLKLQQITGGFIQRKDEYFDEETQQVRVNNVTFPVGSEKLDVCLDLVQRYTDNHKIIIGCRFIWEINQLESLFSKHKIRFSTIRGGVSGDQRTDIRRDFQEASGSRVLIFQISAATAMTLTAADIGILYSSTQKWDDYWQWLKRIHRDGQNKSVYILRLVVKGSVDNAILRSINEKRAFTDYMIDREAIKSVIKLID